jgi:hypothetical protein
LPRGLDMPSTPCPNPLFKPGFSPFVPGLLGRSVRTVGSFGGIGVELDSEGFSFDECRGSDGAAGASFGVEGNEGD